MRGKGEGRRIGNAWFYIEGHLEHTHTYIYIHIYPIANILGSCEPNDRHIGGLTIPGLIL